MILAINTSTPQFGVALLRRDGSLLCEYSTGMRRRLFKPLMPVLDTLLRLSGRRIKDLEAVALATGPGSFTGVRVGVSLAKGLAHGLGIPLVGINSLEALAAQAAFAGPAVRPIIESRKGEIFTALFNCSATERIRRLEEDRCLVHEQIPSPGPGGVVFVGNDYQAQAPVLRSLLGPGVCLAPPRLWITGASSVGAAGLARLDKGDTDDPGELAPAYYRPPDIRPDSSRKLSFTSRCGRGSQGTASRKAP